MLENLGCGDTRHMDDHFFGNGTVGRGTRAGSSRGLSIDGERHCPPRDTGTVNGRRPRQARQVVSLGFCPQAASSAPAFANIFRPLPPQGGLMALHPIFSASVNCEGDKTAE